MAQVIVQLATSPASEAEAQQHTAFRQARKFGAALRAMHPQSEDPKLAGWFTAQVDNGKAGELVEQLRSIPDVTAAYVKPRAAMP
jgi:hypothetical protein